MIELKIDDFRDGKVTFHISRQDKEDYERLRQKTFHLTLSDGLEYGLNSVYCPCYFARDLFVRGTNSEKDNTKIVATFTNFLKIFELVKEYNKIF